MSHQNKNSPLASTNRPRSWLEFLAANWFLFAIFILFPAGMFFGKSLMMNSWFNLVYRFLNPELMTFFILFQMSWTLATSKIKEAFNKPLAVFIALITGYIFIPVLGYLVRFVPLNSELAMGIMITCSIPTTLATASVYTRQANGNDAVSLITTLFSNLLSPFVTPFLIFALCGKIMAVNQSTLLFNLLLIALLPTVLGQLFRVPFYFRNLADSYKTLWSTSSQIGILWMIFRTSAGQSSGLQEMDATLLYEIFLTWLLCSTIHLVSIFTAYFTGQAAGCSRENLIAIMFSSSQKTLPVGVYIASILNPQSGLMVLPIVVFHVNQLIMDSWIVAYLKSHGSQKLKN